MSDVTAEAEPGTESGTRSRTRQAILEAAAEALAEDGTASLADIAERADVGRSTLHRYFPDRAELVRAVARFALARIDEALRRAEPERGPFVDALRRTVDALLDHGPITMFLYSDPQVVGDPLVWDDGEEPDEQSLERLFAREESQLRPEITPAWANSVFWALLYAGWEAGRAGTMSRQQIVDAVMASFTGGVLAGPGADGRPAEARDAGTRGAE